MIAPDGGAGWGPITIRVAPPWAAVDLDALGLAVSVWNTLVVPLPPARLVADPALAAGRVEIFLGGEVVAAGHGDQPGPTIFDALVTAAHRWLTPALVATLLDLAVPLETLERFRAAVPPAAQTTLLTRLLADRIALADLPLIAEVCVGEMLGLRLQGRDLSTIDAARLDDGLELASRLALCRRISLAMAMRGRVDLVHVTPAVAGAVARGEAPVEALVAALDAAGGLGATSVVVVSAQLRRRLRELLAGPCPTLPVLAADELIAMPQWRVGPAIDRLPADRVA